MAIYYGLLLWFIICCFIFSFFRFEEWKFFQFIACVIPALLISACRGVSVGTDTPQYVDATSIMQLLGYRGYENSGMYANYEPFFKALMYICTQFDDSSRALIVISSLIIVIIPFYVIYKISSFPALGYVFYFLSTMYYFDITAMRQSLSLAFLFLVIYALYEGKEIKALVFLFCAVMFHMTALIFLPVYLMAKVKPKKNLLVYSVFGIAVVMVVGRLLPKLFTLISKYNGYASSSYLTSGKMMPFIQIVFFGALLIIFLHYTGDVLPEDLESSTHRLWNMATYSCAFMVLVGCSVFYVNVFYRFMYIFLPVICLIFPNFLWENYINKTISNHSVICYVAILIFFLSFLFVPDTWFGLNPYLLYQK